MSLQRVDVAIILGYFAAVMLIGLWVSRRGAKDLDSYFLWKSCSGVRLGQPKIHYPILK
jgi:hypothetical protein